MAFSYNSPFTFSFYTFKLKEPSLSRALSSEGQTPLPPKKKKKKERKEKKERGEIRAEMEFTY